MNKDEAIQKYMADVTFKTTTRTCSEMWDAEKRQWHDAEYTWDVQVEYGHWKDFWRDAYDHNAVEIFHELYGHHAEIPYDYWRFDTDSDIGPDAAAQMVRNVFQKMLEDQHWCAKHGWCGHEDYCWRCDENED